MKHLEGILVILLVAVSSCVAGWTVTVWPPKLGSPESAVITYSTNKTEGCETFAASLGQLRADGKLDRLRSVQIHALLHDDAFQKEIIDELDRIAPEELRQALNSAGNMHNPQMMQLNGPFMKAVSATTVVKAISSELASRGLKVEETTGEKFVLLTEGKERHFYSGLTLVIEKHAEPSVGGDGKPSQQP